MVVDGIKRSISNWARTVLRVPPPAPTSAKAQHPITLWPRFYDNQPMKWMRQDLQSYAEEGFSFNSLIYSAIMYKSRAQQAAPLRAYAGTFDQPERLPLSHDLAALVYRPNNFQSWSEFHGLQTVFLNLAGNSYTYLERSRPGGTVERLLPLRPDWVYHIPSGGNTLLGYVYCPTGTVPEETVPLLPEDIIHVKLPNPLDPLNGLGPGLSPMASLAVSGDVDNMASKFLRGFFRSGAMPIGVLRYPVSLDPETMDEIRERWRDKYGGALNWLDVAVLSDSGEYQRIGLTFDEMGFADLDQRNETRILGPLGVPPILIGARSGLDRSTFSNTAEARQAFWMDTFYPEMLLHEVAYQYALTGEDGSFVAFDFSEVTALQQNLPPLVDAAHKLWTMGYPAGVATRLVGLTLPHVPGDDVAYVPMNLLPVGRYQEDAGTPVGAVAIPAVEGDESADDAVVEKALLRPGGNNGNGYKKAVPDPFRGNYTIATRARMAFHRSDGSRLGARIYRNVEGGDGTG